MVVLLYIWGNFTKKEYVRVVSRETEKVKRIDEVPIGCVIVKDSRTIARGHNLRETKQQLINYTEIIVIQKACKRVGSQRLEGCDLHVTLEPCHMCAGAVLQSRIRTIIYGTADPGGGSIESTLHIYEQPGYDHYPKVESSIPRNECSQLLENFFKEKELKKK